MKNIKFKIQVVAICFMLCLNIAFAQQDSLKNPDTLKTRSVNISDEVIYVEDCTFSYMDLSVLDSIKVKKVNQIMENKFENIFRITFKKNNYLDLLNSSGESKTVNLKYANEVTINKGHYTLIGALAGLAVGTLTGFIIGNSYDERHNGVIFKDMGKGYGFAIGAPVGLLIGIITGSLIQNTETLNLESIKEKERQDELRNFLRNNSSF